MHRDLLAVTAQLKGVVVASATASASVYMKARPVWCARDAVAWAGDDSVGIDAAP